MLEMLNFKTRQNFNNFENKYFMIWIKKYLLFNFNICCWLMNEIETESREKFEN